MPERSVAERGMNDPIFGRTPLDLSIFDGSRPQVLFGHCLMAVQPNCPKENEPGSWVSPQAAAKRRRVKPLTATRGSAPARPRSRCRRDGGLRFDERGRQRADAPGRMRGAGADFPDALVPTSCFDLRSFRVSMGISHWLVKSLVERTPERIGVIY